LFFRLDPSQLDGRTPDNTWDALRTSINVGAITPRWSGQPRINPGLPASSLVMQLISQRGTDQMPPIDSVIVDTAGVQLISNWISSMPYDAGVDSGPDSGPDASSGDGGSDAGDGGIGDGGDSG
jgi:hypothetical protein